MTGKKIKNKKSLARTIITHSLIVICLSSRVRDLITAINDKVRHHLAPRIICHVVVALHLSPDGFNLYTKKVPIATDSGPRI